MDQVLELDIWTELMCLQMCTISPILRTWQWITWFHKTRDIPSLAEEHNFSLLALNYEVIYLEVNFKCVKNGK